MLMLRLHVHEDEPHRGVAVLFRFKGIAEHADEVEPAVCRKMIGKVLLDVQIVLYKYCAYHSSFSFAGIVMRSAKRGSWEICISPPWLSMLWRSAESPLPSLIGPVGTVPLLVMVMS